VIVGGESVDGWNTGGDRKALTGEAGEQLESKVGRSGCVLKIEKAVELRHAIPPSRHEGQTFGRHEFVELVELDVPIADVVVTGIIQASLLHLVDDFAEIAWLVARI